MWYNLISDLFTSVNFCQPLQLFLRRFKLMKELEKVSVIVEYHDSADEVTFAIMCTAFNDGKTLYCFKTSCANHNEFFTISVCDTVKREGYDDFFMIVPDQYGLSDSRIHDEDFPEDLKPLLVKAWREELDRFFDEIHKREAHAT